MPLPVLPLHTHHPVFHCPFSGALVHDPKGIHLGPTVLYVHDEASDELWTESRTVRALADELARLGGPLDLGDWLAEHLRCPGAVAFRIDRGWDGVITYAVRPPPKESAASSTGP